MTSKRKPAKPGRSHTPLITDPGVKGRLKATKETGGWDPKSKKWMPMDYEALSKVSRSALYPFLDFLAAAIEEDALTAENIFAEAFRDPADWDALISELEDYPYWINERWYYALLAVELLGDEDAVFEEVAATMRESLEDWRAAQEKGLAAQSKPPSPKAGKKTRKNAKSN